MAEAGDSDRAIAGNDPRDRRETVARVLAIAEPEGGVRRIVVRTGSWAGAYLLPSSVEVDLRPGDLVVIPRDADHASRQLQAVQEAGGPTSSADLLARLASANSPPRLLRRYDGPPYPNPTSEVARLSRERVTALRQRAEALRATRELFFERGFLEVETPLLVPSPGLEIHLDAVPAGGGYLITSPEYQMKRLLAGGLEKIYQVCKCFRGNESGPHHSGEFTMIEWYRANADLESIIDDTEQLVAKVAMAVASTMKLGAPDDMTRALRRMDRGHHPGDASHDDARRVLDVTPPWPRLTVRDAMRTFAGVDVLGDEPAADLVAKVRKAGIECDDCAWDDAFFAAFLAKVEPAINAMDRPLILCDWPAPLAALARRKPGEPLTALRFEAYAGGFELANAFDELTDPVEQRARFEDDLRIRRARGRATYPIDEKLLAALAEGLPPSAGIALGFDRMVMLATGARAIDQVLSFTAAEL